MRRMAVAVCLALAAVLGAGPPVLAQTTTPTPVPPEVFTSTSTAVTPLSGYVMGGVACAAVSPMIGTALLGREMTAVEVGRSTLNCFFGPVGWLIGPILFPDVVLTQAPPPAPSTPPGPRRARGPNVSVPPAGETRFVPDEVLLQVSGGVSAQRLAAVAQRLQLTRLEVQTFALTGRTLERWRIGGNRSVRATLRALARAGVVAYAQANMVYTLQQQPTAAAAPAGDAQYVVTKLRLREAHGISSGDAVSVAVIDSRIDTGHPDLAGVFAGEEDVVGDAGPSHAHGTGMAGAIAAHTRLIGVAPKVRLLAVRAFSGGRESAQGTTFNILKALDVVARHDVRVVNMSFAGPVDEAMRATMAAAHARGMVLIAAVGNAGPRSPPLYPAAYRHVIGVTATDADDKLLPQAVRGTQVVVAAPGVDILAPSPDGQYQLTSGTSVAAAHVSGVAALMLARDPALTPDAVRRGLVAGARKVGGPRRDVGAGVIDALAAVEAVKK